VGTTSSFFHGFAFLLSSDVGWPHAVLAPVMLSLKAWFKVSFSFPIFCPLTACIGASVNSLGLVGAAARSRFRSLHTPENLFRFLYEGFRRVGCERPSPWILVQQMYIHLSVLQSYYCGHLL
jgi:hypothetical protein